LVDLKSFFMERNHRLAWQALEEHFGQQTINDIVCLNRRFPTFLYPDLQAAVVTELKPFAPMLFGLHQPHEFHALVMSGLIIRDRNPQESLTPIQYDDVDIGEALPIACIKNGLWLLCVQEVPLAVLLAQFRDATGARVANVEIAYPSGKAAADFVRCFFDKLREATATSRLYRGKTLSFEQEARTSGEMLVHRLPTVERNEVILNPATMRQLDRNIFEFNAHKVALKVLRQSIRKGILLYGPPGTGKTHIIRYITSSLVDHTTVLIIADQVKDLRTYMELARILQPSIVVIEDIDLIGRSRDAINSFDTQMLLNSLLNEMDGLREDADILFILTTNRPRDIEEALASRPGRIDEAIEIPLPDEECRIRLIALYGQALTLADGAMMDVVSGSAGASAAFIKEFVRRIAQHSLIRGASGHILREDVAAVLQEINASGREINRRLLGATPSVDGC
jgi:cell division protease FtsH